MSLRPFLLAALLAVLALPPASASPLDDAATLAVNAPGFIVIQRDLDTGAYTYQSSLAACSSTSGSIGVTVRCSLPNVAGVPQQCAKTAAVQVVAASLYRSVQGTAYCSYGGYVTAFASCYTDPIIGVNTAACAWAYPLAIFGFPIPWWSEPTNQVVCSSSEWETILPAASAMTLSKGSYTVTCLYA